MEDSDSVQFSDKLSYKILCILSYGLKDMIYARYQYFLEFQKKTENRGAFSHQAKPSP
jgi:hypothetical protein